MTDQFDEWRQRLSGIDVERSVNEPQAGFYRIRSRDKKTRAVSFQAAAYWYEDGKLYCTIDGIPVRELIALEQWPWASANPVSYEAYVAVTDHGEPWPENMIDTSAKAKATKR